MSNFAEFIMSAVASVVIVGGLFLLFTVGTPAVCTICQLGGAL